ncbi:hypothetical protein K492DRAFT_177311 [Lichtheimia hyalospora FSU 10163]|nr:hypothetical protein K492DRAFT_177311 [Lichtheimia hyalospora FSU 10163]
MQFIHSSPFYGGGYNASQQQALQQQGQQGQQPQQPHSPHTSQSPATSSAAVDQQQQPPQPQGLSLPVAALQSFAQANGIPVQAAPELNAQGKPKRKQVKNACVNCQKACKKCDDGRPCQRCIKYGLQDTCVNSVRKERKKGIKRGPYKKRKQDGGSTDGSAASTPATSLPAGLYAPTTQGSAAGVRTTNGVLAYPSFQSGTYDAAFHAAAVSYQNSASMIPHAYMVPAAIQQMYPPNTMLSYQAAMNMLSPQHGQPSPNIYGYRPDAASSQQQQQQQQQATQQENDSQNAQHRSHEGSPATPNGVGTPNSNNNNNAIKPETTESDDEGSKLNILSQLCSAVLDRTPDTSNATTSAVSQATTTTTNAAATTNTSPTTTSAPIKTEQADEQKPNEEANVKLESKDSSSSPSNDTAQETSNEGADAVKKEEPSC